MIVQNSYRLIYKIIFDVCKMFGGNITNILLTPYFEYWQPYTNVITGCPFKSNVNSIFFDLNVCAITRYQ